MTMVKEFKEFNCFITLYSQTLGVGTRKVESSQEQICIFFNLGLYRNLLCDVIWMRL